MTVSVAGVGMTRFGKFPGRKLPDLAAEAAAAALADADITISDVQAVYAANAVGGLLAGQEMIRGEVAMRAAGIGGVPIFNVENACASSSSAFHLAWQAVAAGAVDCALAVGAEHMSADKGAAFAAIGTGVDVEARDEIARELGAEPGVAKQSLFMHIYASMVRRHMDAYGTTQHQLAAVAAKNSRHGAANPLAQYRDARSVEDVLASREVVWPLTLLMCSPIGDGAAAAVLRRALPGDVKVAASAVRTAAVPDTPAEPAARRAATAAFEQAGLGPTDVDVVEVHDATSPAEILALEELGFFAPGEAAPAAERGDTTLGGVLPVNPSGGLCSRGHPIGATGLAQICELTWQLRNQAGRRQVQSAKVALAHNGGGHMGNDYAVQVVTILTV
jgi:acetyl-CoA acetyltransferase